MVKKLNIKILAIILGVLVVLLIVTQVIEKRKGNSSFKSDLITIDSTKVTSITVYPRHHHDKPYRLFLNGKSWEISFDGKTMNADEMVVLNLLRTLKDMKTKLVASKDKNQWADYQVVDSAATHIKIEQGKEIVVDMYIGRFTFQKSGEPNPQNGQQNGDITSFVRFEGDETVYGVDGMISMLFNRDLMAFRNKNVINSEKFKWEKLTFTYPDSSFVVEKKKNEWFIAGQKVDSTAMEHYLKNASYICSTQFEDSKPQLKSAVARLKIEGKGIEPIEISAFLADSIKHYYLKTSVNPETTFADKSNDLIKTIFFPKSKFFTPVR